LGRTHEGNIAKYRFHNRSREEAEEAKGRIEFQQFETEETERTKEEGGIVYRRKRHPNRFAEHMRREQERIIETELNLQPIEEDREESESPAPSMAESEHPNSSNQSGSREETRDSIPKVSLLVGL
jgi:hypothetical protein